MSELWEMGLPFKMMLVFFLVGSPAAIMYPVILGFVKWEKSKIGRSMMAKGVALLLIFLQGLASLEFSHHSWYPWFVAVVTGWLAFAVWYQTTTVIQVIREGEVEKRMTMKKE